MKQRFQLLDTVGFWIKIAGVAALAISVLNFIRALSLAPDLLFHSANPPYWLDFGMDALLCVGALFIVAFGALCELAAELGNQYLPRKV